MKIPHWPRQVCLQEYKATDIILVMDHTPKSTVAIVVTYKREALLKECLLALESQGLNQIIVVNNGGVLDSLTCEMVNSLSQQILTPTVLINTDENLGGAGGFALGIEAGIERGFDYLWLMDDDCIPDEGSLAALLKVAQSGYKDSLGRPHGFYASRVFWTDQSLHNMNVPELSPKWFQAIHLANSALEIQRCSFVSVLVPSAVVRKIGLPIKEFFIWGDDVEFTLRISDFYGYGQYCLDSSVHHMTTSNEKVDFRNISKSAAWKYQYAIVNSHATLWGRRKYYQAISSLLRTLFDITFGDSQILVKKSVLGGLIRIPNQARVVAKYNKGLKS